MLFIKIPAAKSGVFIRLVVEQQQLLLHSGIKGLKASKFTITKRCIDMGIDNTYRLFHHCLIPGAIWPGSSKSGSIVFAKLIT